MQIAFHSNHEPADAESFRSITIGPTTYNVVAHCWENGGADAAWQTHRDSLYGGSGKPQRREGNVAEAEAGIDNCLPSSAKDEKLPKDGEVYCGYTGSDRFVECVHECLQLVGCYAPCALGFQPRLPGFLRNDLPEDVRATIGTLKEWVGTATFFYGARGVFQNATPPIDDVAPIALMEQAAKLHTSEQLYTGRRNGGENQNIKERLWRAVFNAVYTSVTLHNGFGMKILMTADGRRNAVTALRNALPGAQRGAWPPARADQDPAASAPTPLERLLDACVTTDADSPDCKTYDAINPDRFPWALGAAVIYAHDLDDDQHNGFKTLVKL